MPNRINATLDRERPGAQAKKNIYIKHSAGPAALCHQIFLSDGPGYVANAFYLAFLKGKHLRGKEKHREDVWEQLGVCCPSEQICSAYDAVGGTARTEVVC